jgi:hypothetical protein
MKRGKQRTKDGTKERTVEEKGVMTEEKIEEDEGRKSRLLLNGHHVCLEIRV